MPQPPMKRARRCGPVSLGRVIQKDPVPVGAPTPVV